jgi:D-alanyl-D-alanine dipeptidase
VRAAAVATLLALLPLAAQAQVTNRGRVVPDLVYLRDVDPSIRQDMRYAGQDNFTGHPLPGYRAAECLLRRPVALALKRVQVELARDDLSLKVYDCYRPARATAAMARWARNPSATPDTRRFYPSLRKSNLFHGYISSSSAHSRGVAIDLTLVPRHAPAPARFDPAAHYSSCIAPVAQRAPDDSIDMGTGYDCFDTKSHTRSPGLNAGQRAARERLRAAMTRHGFKNYFREWWHYSYPAADPGVAFDVPIEKR